MTVEAIKDAIQGLSDQERASLAAWLNEMEYDEWDKQMVQDFSPGGRGAKWVKEAKQEIATGETRLLEEGLGQLPGKRS